MNRQNSYTNKGNKEENVSLAGNMPFGVLIPLNLDEHNGAVFAKRGAYFASDRSVSVRAKMLQAASCTACCCAGMPPVGQLISGPSGSMAFLLGSGTVMKKELADGEKILLSTEALVAFTDGMSVDVRTVGSCTTCCFGGEGCFNTVMTGPGTVYVHSFGLEKLKKIVRAMARPERDNNKDGHGGAPITEVVDSAEDIEATAAADDADGAVVDAAEMER